MLSPVEAATVLGVAPSAPIPDVESAYAARLSAVPMTDTTTRDLLTAARDALVAAARWQAPGGAVAGGTAVGAGGAYPGGAQPQQPQQPGAFAPPAGYSQQPGAYALGAQPTQPGQPVPPAAHPQQPAAFPAPAPQPAPAAAYPQHPAAYPPPAPSGPYTAPAPFTAPGGSYPPPAPFTAPVGFYPPPAPPGHGTHPYAPTPYPPYASTSYPPYASTPYPPYAPPRRGPSTGAILGWVFGGFAVLLVLVVVAVVVIANSVRPILPTPNAASGGSGGSNEYVVDGVEVQYGDEGWDFTLTSPQDCPAAAVTVGFSSASDGPADEEFTDTVSLEAGVPHIYSVPYEASDLQYASIEAIDCGAGDDGTGADGTGTDGTGTDGA